MSSTLEARLQYLEAREEAHTRDIIRLKTENAELSSKVCELKRENLQTTERLLDTESKYQKMENDLKVIFGFRESIENRLSSLESNMKSMKEFEDRLGSLETVLNELRQEEASGQDDEREKVTCQGDGSQSVDHIKVIGRLQKWEESVIIARENSNRRFNKLEKDVADARQESSTVRQIVMDKLKLSEREAQETHKNVRELMEVRDAISKSVTSVMLKPKHKPKTEEMVKLDKCETVLVNGGYFNERLCCLAPLVGGDFVMTIAYRQIGAGKISMYYRAGSGKYIFVGSTFGDDGAVSHTDHISLGKGEKLWVEMKRMKGNADLDFCYLDAWLISPSLH